MAATGRDGGRGPSVPWRYRLREQTGGSNSYDNSIISSSSSGTIVSTTYTSGGSRLSSISMDAVSHFELALLDEDTELVRPTKKSCKEREMKHMDIKSLVQEFFGAPSAECSININSNNSGDMSVLERWFSELGVDWVLRLPDDASAGKLEHTSAASSWIRGLSQILETIRGSIVFVRGSLGQVTDSDKQANIVTDDIRHALFAKEAMSKMLPFVDIAIRQVVVSNNEMPLAPYKKLHTLLTVYKALSDAQAGISWLFHSDYSAEAEAPEGVMVTRLLSAKQGEAGEAIWNTMEHIRTRALESIDIEYVDDTSSSLIPQVSSDIHKATLFVMEYISFLCSNYKLMRDIVSKAVSLGKYVPQIVELHPLESMIMNIKSCLQEKLVKMSESLQDQGLRILFLLNNLEFIRQSLMGSDFYYCVLYNKEDKALAKKVKGYMESYLQACWAPVLSCLFSATHLCFGINLSPLKFEYEFKKTYATQKLWKVPDPKLRKSLRAAIIEKIVPRYTEYMKENNITTPRFAPQDLEKMLHKLFEG